MTRILFVCLGNICRSPMAEFVMKDLVEKAGIAEKNLKSPPLRPVRKKWATRSIHPLGKNWQTMPFPV